MNWTCPDVGTKKEDVKKKVWDAGVIQYNKRYAKRIAAKGISRQKI